MPHVIEPAASGRAGCRGCESRIAKGELRFGERLPNPYGEGEMTLWFHLDCAAFKRPEPFLEAIDATELEVENADTLRASARLGLAHRRLPRVNGAHRSPTGRARCRSCRELIPKDAWRIALVFYDDGRFEPAGFIHAGCSETYFETTDLLDRARHFSPELSDSELAELDAALSAGES